ncbi:MAG: hypothetical protein AB8U69_02380 [Anaplasma ovis]
MSWEQFLSGGDSPRRAVVLQVPESDSGLGAGVELILRLPLSLVLLATTVLLTTITYVAMTIAMIVVLPVRFLAGFFSKRGRQASAGGEEEGREPVNGVRNFFMSLVKVVPVIVLWPVIALFTAVPALIVSTFVYVSSVVKSCVEYLTCAITFGDPTKVGYLGRALYDNYVSTSGIRAATDLAVSFFDESGPHAGVTHHWNEMKSAVTGHPMDIMKSMLGGGLAYSFGGIAGGSIFPTRSSPAAGLADADAVPATSLAGARVSAAQGQSAPGGGLGAS